MIDDNNKWKIFIGILVMIVQIEILGHQCHNKIKTNNMISKSQIEDDSDRNHGVLVGEFG